MNVYFVTSSKKRILLAKTNTPQEVGKIIYNFLENKGYESFYHRWWKEKDVYVCDFGSYSEFFEVTDFNAAFENYIMGR